MAYPKPYAPVTLKRLYRQLDLPTETTDLLHRYFSAMSQFYLIMPLYVAYTIITGQNPDLELSEEKFNEFASIARREEQPYQISGREEFYKDHEPEEGLNRLIVSKELIGPRGDFSYFKDVDGELTGKYYRVLPKDELLRYEEPGYRKILPEETALRKKLTDEYGAEEELVDEAIDVLYSDYRTLGVSRDTMTNLITGELRRVIPSADNEAFSVDNMNGPLMACFNLLNAWPNPLDAGYSPYEYITEVVGESRRMRSEENLAHALEDGMDPIELIATIFATENLTDAQRGEMIDEIIKAMPKDQFEANREFLTAVQNPDFRGLLLKEMQERADKKISPAAGGKQAPVRSKKIGRNEPCPCGSGKKYKNCCGRPGSLKN